MISRSPRWNPAQYGKFAAERMRPVADLLAQVPLDAPSSIHDLGCGDGRVTRLLAERWPEARITDVDSSPDMLEAARKALPGVEWPQVEWVEADLAAWTAEAPADVVFANASLQWLDDHEALFPRLMARLAAGGALAVQMPRNFDAASHVCMREAAAAGPWKGRLEEWGRQSPVAEASAYYAMLAPHAAHIDIWESDYIHPLEGDDPVVEWTMGTGLRPYLAPLDEAKREAFLADYRLRIARAYPRRDDGVTLFPFRRLFIVATR